MPHAGATPNIAVRIFYNNCLQLTAPVDLKVDVVSRNPWSSSRIPLSRKLSPLSETFRSRSEKKFASKFFLVEELIKEGIESFRLIVRPN